MALKFILLGGGKCILECSSKTCNEAVLVLKLYRAAGINPS